MIPAGHRIADRLAAESRQPGSRSPGVGAQAISFGKRTTFDTTALFESFERLVR
jgi:hypothetical protein